MRATETENTECWWKKKESISAASRWRNRSNIIVVNPNHCRKYATRKQHRIKKQVYLDDVFDIDWLSPNVVCVCVRARCICTLVTFFASSNVHFLWVCCAFCYILFYFLFFYSLFLFCLSFFCSISNAFVNTQSFAIALYISDDRVCLYIPGNALTASLQEHKTCEKLHFFSSLSLFC